MPKSISSIVRDVAPELENVVMRALEKDPDRRWLSMEQFGRALGDSLRIGIVDLEYASDDDTYSSNDATTVAPRPDSKPPMLAPMGDDFDDATVRLDRTGPSQVAVDFSDRTEVMAKRGAHGDAADFRTR